MSFNFQEINHTSFTNFANCIEPKPPKCVTVHRKCDYQNESDFGKTLCVLNEPYIKYAERVKNFEVREDDVWIVTYPKCGTTWTQEMVWLICNDLDYKTAKEVKVYDRSVFFEFGTLVEGFHDTLKIVEDMQSPRHIKSHLPKSMLPDQIWEKKPKIVYVARNPKDVVVSYYHHHRLLDGFKGSLEVFVQAFIDDLVPWSPYWDHILDFWKLRNEKNVLFLTYEDMKKDLPKIIRSTCEFFQKSYTDGQIADLAEHLSFDSMKNNEACNIESAVEMVKQIRGFEPPRDLKFMRSGKAGSWRNELDKDMSCRIDEWSRKHISGTDFDLWEI